MSEGSILLEENSRNRPGFHRDVSSAVLLGLVLLLAIALRLYDLGTESYWIDEMSTVIEGQQSIPELLASGRLDQPPAYYLPFILWVRVFGTAEVSTRSFSVLASVGSIVLIYLIGQELFGKTVGLLSAFLMAISGFQIYYSQEARYYASFEFTTLLSYLFFILALKSKRMVHFALYGVSSILVVYSHTYGIFILAAQNLFFILQWKKYRNVITTWLICQALILLALVPSFYLLIFGAGGLSGAVNSNIGISSAPSLWDPFRSVYRFIIPARRELSWGIVLASGAAAGALFVAGIWIHAIRQGKSNFFAAARGLPANLQQVPDMTGKLLLVSCWLLCPILLPFTLSMVIDLPYLDRYTIGAAPAAYLLLALGLFSSRKVVPLWISLAVLAILIIPGLREYYATDVKEQWTEAAAYVEENSGPDEVLVFAPNYGIGIQQETFNWYYRGTLQGCGLSNNLTEPIAISNALMQCVSGRDRFWVIMREPADGYKSLFLSPSQTAIHVIKKHQFVSISVYLFEFTK